LNADFAVVLKKDRSNQQLFERIKYLREIIRLHGKGTAIKLPPGAVAILPDGCDDEPGAYAFLKRADLRQVPCEHFVHPTEPLDPPLREFIASIRSSVRHDDTESESSPR
jgi:hypothetical protein